MGQPSQAFGTGLVSRGMGPTVTWLAHWLRRAEARRPGGRLGAAQRDCAQFSSRDVQFPPFWTQRQPLHTLSARVLGALEVRGALAL